MEDVFDDVTRRLNDVVDEEIECKVVSSPRATSGDVVTVVEQEKLDVEYVTGEYVETDQTTIEFVGDSGIYARALFHVVPRDGDVVLLDWIEVVDEENRGCGIGRALSTAVVEYIRQVINPEQIVLKLENEQMRSVVRDAGFEEAFQDLDNEWYQKEQ